MFNSFALKKKFTFNNIEFEKSHKLNQLKNKKQMESFWKEQCYSEEQRVPLLQKKSGYNQCILPALTIGIMDIYKTDGEKISNSIAKYGHIYTTHDIKWSGEKNLEQKSDENVCYHLEK